MAAPTPDTANAPGESAYRPTAGFVGLMGLMAALGAVTTDMYLPALPVIAADLDTSPASVQLTISATLLGAAVGQLVVGPLSDRFGRRRPALVGIGVHVVTSIACIVAPSIGVLVALRVLQGMGNSAAGVTAMATVRDRLSGGAAARVLSRLMLVLGVAPLLAPSIGGLIGGVVGWRGVFGALALFGVVLFVVVWRYLPETLPPERRVARGAGVVVAGYRSLLTDRRFLALAVLPGLAMGAILAYVAAAPFVLQDGYGLDVHQFAVVFAVIGLGGTLVSQINASLLGRWSPMAILRVALPGVVVLAAVLVAVVAAGATSLWALLVPLWLVMSAVIFVPPNASALALTRRGDRAGSAAALMGGLQVGTAAVVSALVGVLGGGALAMAGVMLAVLLVALAVLAVGTSAYRRLPEPVPAPVVACTGAVADG